MVDTTTESRVGSENRINGLTGVFARLVQEHRELTSLMLQLRLSSDAELREQIFPRVRDAVLCHERAETQVVYLAMSKKEQTRLIAAKHRRTAGELETLVERLCALEPSSARWESTFGLLFEAFEQHAIEEESYYFPIAQRVLGEAKARALLEPYEAARGADDRESEAFSYARDAVRAATETRAARVRRRRQ
jgi:hypothetical protein